MSENRLTKLEKRENLRLRRVRSLDNFFNAPFLLDSENISEFKALSKKLRSEMPCLTVMDRYNTDRIIQSIWLWQRTLRLQAGAIAGTRTEALIQLIEPKYGQLKYGEKPIQFVIDYFNGTKSERQNANRKIESMGITLDEIEARAFELQRETIIILDKMRARNEATIDAAEKKLTHLKKKAEKRVNKARSMIKSREDSWE